MRGRYQLISRARSPVSPPTTRWRVRHGRPAHPGQNDHGGFEQGGRADQPDPLGRMAVVNAPRSGSPESTATGADESITISAAGRSRHSRYPVGGAGVENAQGVQTPEDRLERLLQVGRLAALARSRSNR